MKKILTILAVIVAVALVILGTVEGWFRYIEGKNRRRRLSGNLHTQKKGR